MELYIALSFNQVKKITLCSVIYVVLNGLHWDKATVNFFSIITFTRDEHYNNEKIAVAR